MEHIEKYIVERLRQLETETKEQAEKIDKLNDKIAEFEEMRKLLSKNTTVKFFSDGRCYIDYLYSSRQNEINLLIDFYGITADSEEDE